MFNDVLSATYNLIFDNQFCYMKKIQSQRRRFIKNISAGVGALYLPLLSTSQNRIEAQKKKIVCVGGHPDDPESGCGGTLAKFAAAGSFVFPGGKRSKALSHNALLSLLKRMGRTDITAHGFRSTFKQFIFNQQKKENEAEAQK